MKFIDKIKNIQNRNNSLLCIGLDSDIEKIPTSLRKSKYPQFEFNKEIIEATKDLVCAYKLNLAFYEAAGKSYYETITRTLDYIPKYILTIADGKRGDIGNTAEQYAKNLFDNLHFDAATVNPYMGKDSIEPFIKNDNHGVFILTLTSNPGSHDFQYLKAKQKPLYEHVAIKAVHWNTKDNIGLVVGATHSAELKRIRSIVPNMPILIPGIGAQSGDLKSTVRYGSNKEGLLAIINVSRGIIYASSGNDFAAQARMTAAEYRDKINYYRDSFFK